jgi:hypothetical protein
MIFWVLATLIYNYITEYWKKNKLNTNIEIIENLENQELKMVGYSGCRGKFIAPGWWLFIWRGGRVHFIWLMTVKFTFNFSFSADMSCINASIFIHLINTLIFSSTCGLKLLFNRRCSIREIFIWNGANNRIKVRTHDLINLGLILCSITTYPRNISR